MMFSIVQSKKKKHKNSELVKVFFHQRYYRDVHRNYYSFALSVGGCSYIFCGIGSMLVGLYLLMRICCKMNLLNVDCYINAHCVPVLADKHSLLTHDDIMRDYFFRHREIRINWISTIGCKNIYKDNLRPVKQMIRKTYLDTRSALLTHSLQEVKSALVFTDGSYYDAKNIAGYAMTIILNNEIYETCNYNKCDSDATAAEFRGAIEAMKFCYDRGVTILNLGYDMEAIKQAAIGNFKTQRELFYRYHRFYLLMSQYMTINFIKVKAHSNEVFNNNSDALARLVSHGKDFY